MDGWIDTKIGFALLPRASTNTDVKRCLRGAVWLTDQPDTGRKLRPGLSRSQGRGAQGGMPWAGEALPTAVGECVAVDN